MINPFKILFGSRLTKAEIDAIKDKIDEINSKSIKIKNALFKEEILLNADRGKLEYFNNFESIKEKVIETFNKYIKEIRNVVSTNSLFYNKMRHASLKKKIIKYYSTANSAFKNYKGLLELKETLELIIEEINNIKAISADDLRKFLIEKKNLLNHVV